MMELYWELIFLVFWRHISDGRLSTWNFSTYSMMWVPFATLLLSRLCSFLSPFHFWIGLNFCYKVAYHIWNSEFLLYWRRTEHCRLNFRQLLDRCWTWSPPQQERWIYPNMCCPRKLLNVWWSDYLFLYVPGVSGWKIDTCLLLVRWALDFTVNRLPYWLHFLFMGDSYLRIVKYKTAYYSFYLPVRLLCRKHLIYLFWVFAAVDHTCSKGALNIGDEVTYFADCIAERYY